MAKNENLSTRDVLIEEHKSIIDTWFANGMNGTKAVLEHRPELSYGAARPLFNAIIKKPENQAYIQECRQLMRASVGLSYEQVLNEVQAWVYADPTDYVGLSVEGLKALPSEVKRSLQTIDIQRETYYKADGTPVEKEIVRVKTVNKVDAMNKLIKMLGYYEADNRQRAAGGSVNAILHTLPLEQQREVLQAMATIKKATMSIK